jgi:outer membrane protein assembly factor BamD (BamD/ComL family)
VHIFHYIGHGKYFEQKQDGMLLLEDESGHGKPTSGQHLGAILHDHHTLRLVVLNACEGARTSADDPYTGVAQTLVRQGIPAVLAMQFEIFEDAAITLAQEFYSAIVDGYPVDAALSEARKAIFASNNDVEWGTPVLFMRIPNGVLFRPETPAEKTARLKTERLAAEKAAREKAEREAEEQQAQEQRISLLNHLYDQAKNQIVQQDWSAASDFLVQIQGIEPDFRDITSLLEQVKAEQERTDKTAGFLTQGKEMIQIGEWSRAAEVFEQLLNLAPEHQEAQQLLTKVEAQIKQEKEMREQQAEEHLQAHLANLYDQANTKLSEGDWIDASKLFEEIDQTEPGYRDVKNLLKQAQTEKDRQEKFVGFIAQGKQHLEKYEWMNAIETFQHALVLDSENIEAQALLAEAERGKEINALLNAANKQLLADHWSDAIAKFQAVLELEPAHVEANRQLAGAKIKLAQKIEEDQKKTTAKFEETMSSLKKSPSFPEEIKPSKPSSLPEEIKPRRKPKDLPK